MPSRARSLPVLRLAIRYALFCALIFLLATPKASAENTHPSPAVVGEGAPAVAGSDEGREVKPYPPGDYLCEVWTAENGLPDDSVTAIAQTPDGYLWIGTFNGLARFDGVRFVTFDPANTPALLHARVRRLYVDSQGTLWINTYDGSLTSYRDGKFVLERRNTQLSEGELTPVSSSSNQITFLMSRGELLCEPLTSPARKLEGIVAAASGPRRARLPGQSRRHLVSGW